MHTCYHKHTHGAAASDLPPRQGEQPGWGAHVILPLRGLHASLPPASLPLGMQAAAAAATAIAAGLGGHSLGGSFAALSNVSWAG